MFHEDPVTQFGLGNCKEGTMSLAEKIAEIRPLMTKADIEALIGPVETYWLHDCDHK
jgi:hypothetical protein